MPGDPEAAAALLLGFLNEAAGLIAAARRTAPCGAGSATRWTSSSRGSSSDSLSGAGRGWEDRGGPRSGLQRGGAPREQQSRSAMSDFVMTIAGEAAPTEDTFGVRNPATGEVFAQAPECTRQQLDAAFDAAAKAARDWKADEAARRATLLQAADVLMASTADLAPVLTAEQGKPLSDAGIEVFASAIWCQYFANLDMPTQVIQDDDTAYVELARRPLGVVAAITPWNFPLTLAFWKIAPALLAGNTLVLKPSPYTPAFHAEGRRDPEGRLPPGRGQHHQRRRRPRRVHDDTPRAAQDQLHRIGRDRQEGSHVGGARPQARHPRARRQRPRHRARRRRPGGGGHGDLRRRVQQQRAGLLRHQARLRSRGPLRRRGRGPGGARPQPSRSAKAPRKA